MARPAKIVVLDASVLVKWFVEEKDTKIALQMRSDYENGIIDIWSTQLMPFEVLNALRYSQDLGQDEIEKVGDSLARSQIALYPILDGDLRGPCIRLAFKYGLTLYDASYVALARSIDKVLYTANEKLNSKTSGKENVQLLAQYQSQKKNLI
jgi:predicted nucleic acid-binding protein